MYPNILTMIIDRLKAFFALFFRSKKPKQLSHKEWSSKLAEEIARNLREKTANEEDFPTYEGQERFYKEK